MSADGKIWAIVPAGGSGSRFSDTQDKLLANLQGVPVLIRTLQALLGVNNLCGIIVSASANNLERYQQLITHHLPDAPIRFVEGGTDRRASVFNGLNALPEGDMIVIIHDAARPLIRAAVVEQALESIRQGAAGAVVAVPIHDTVKQTNPDSPKIGKTLDRSTLWRAQTPQVFWKQPLLQAHQQVSPDTPITDDAQLMERTGVGPVVIISGDESNLKITGPNDIRLAEAWLAL